MSTHPQTASSANADQRLSQLIRLKQLEKPDVAFWGEFEQEFRSRQLTTFVQIQPMHTRLRRACLIIARKAAPPVAAAGAVALTFFAVSNSEYLAKGTSEEKLAASSIAPQADQQPKQEAFFIVNAVDSTESEIETSTSDTIYQINALSSLSGTTNGYQLNATPVTYSQGIVTGGANVLSKQPSY